MRIISFSNKNTFYPSLPLFQPIPNNFPFNLLSVKKIKKFDYFTPVYPPPPIPNNFPSNSLSINKIKNLTQFTPLYPPPLIPNNFPFNSVSTEKIKNFDPFYPFLPSPNPFSCRKNNSLYDSLSVKRKKNCSNFDSLP